MFSSSPNVRVPRSGLNHDIKLHLLKVKGLGHINLHHLLRQHEDNLRALTTQDIYEYEEEVPDREAKIRALFHQKKALRKSPNLRPGTLRSADERTKVIEASGRLVIPKQYYDRAVEIYDGSQIIIKDLNLKETEEMQRQFKRIAEMVSPSPKRRLKVKSRVFTPMKTFYTKSVTPTHLEEKYNRMLQMMAPVATLESFSFHSASPRRGRKVSVL